ncbi:MAG: S41 family peptidase [Anaerolineae bacterium]
MRYGRGFIAGLFLGLLIGGAFLLGYLLGNHQRLSGQSGEFSTLWAVRNLLEQKFIGDRPPLKAQVYGATKGLVASYGDPYTVFVEPVARALERDELRGHFGGIGAYISRDEAGNAVLTVMRDRAAARAGVQDGDILLAVDDRPITPEMTVEEIVTLIRGQVGTRVSLRLQRKGQENPLVITVVRARIETPSVEWRVLDGENHIGYVRISIFGEQTARELRSGLAELADQGVSRLVLDLRGNGGGLVDAAVEVASQFLRDGQVLREIKRGGQERFYPVKRSNSPALDWELVLLVDGGTASASEIVAGALRDYRRAILIGEKTFGKGSVQEVHELSDGSSLHVTVARWLTPERHPIDQQGIEPDIQVGMSAEDRQAGRDPQLTRAVAWLSGER